MYQGCLRSTRVVVGVGLYTASIIDFNSSLECFSYLVYFESLKAVILCRFRVKDACYNLMVRFVAASIKISSRTFKWLNVGGENYVILKESSTYQFLYIC